MMNKKNNKNFTDNELYHFKICEKNRKIRQDALKDGITICGYAHGIMEQEEDDALLYGEINLLDLDLFKADKKNKNK